VSALQKPPFVYMDRRIVAWDDAKMHVGAEALIRGISVCEGIKGYWSRDGGRLSLLALREHFEGAETTHPDVRLTPVSFAPRNAEELENAGS
jgi:hypothetical protein